MCVTASCNCDYVEVQDNFSNGTSVIVGRYCMGVAYPHGDIKTRSNNVTVTFRSDSTIGSAGFKARYEAIQVTSKDCKLQFRTALKHQFPLSCISIYARFVKCRSYKSKKKQTNIQKSQTGKRTKCLLN